MIKRRGFPDRRGMGAPSDPLSESFRPTPRHRAEQVARARALLAVGLPLSQIAAMLSLPLEELERELAGPPD